MADQAAPAGYEDFKSSSPVALQNANLQAPAGYEEFIAPERAEEKYGTVPEMAKTAAEGALSAGTFGLGTGLEAKLLGNEKEQLARRDVNPGSHMIGQVGGLLGSSLLIPGGGAAGALDIAGATGAKALGTAAVESVGGRIGAAAVKSAVEGALFQSGDEVSKMLLKDPGQHANTAIANIGLGAALGGLLGGGIGATGELWAAKFGPKLGSSMDAASHAINDEVPIGASSDLASGSQLNSLQNAVGTPGPNTQAAIEAADRLGVDLPSGTTSGKQIIKNIAQSTSERPTFFGQKLDAEFEAADKGLSKASEETLRDQTLKTEAQVGREIKDGIAAKLNEQLKPIEAEYKDLKPHFKNAEVTPELKKIAVDNLMSHEYVSHSPEMASLAEKLSQRIENINNVDQLKTARSLIGDELDKAYRAGGPETQIYKAAKDELTKLRELALDNEAQRGAIPADVAERIKSTDAAYAAYKDKLKSLGVESGLGKINNARGLLDRFSKLSDESFATKAFDLNDINQLNYFKQNFPKEFELARRFKLKDIAEKSVSEVQGKGGKFDVGKFLGQISDKKMNPEARELLFGGNIQKLNDIRTIYREIPGRVNHSGTSTAMSIGHLFSPQGLIDNVSDAGKYALLKAWPHLQEAMQSSGGGQAGELAALKFAASTGSGVDPGAFKQMAAYIGNTIKGETTLSKAASAVFEPGKQVASSAASDIKDRDRLDKKLKDLQADQSPLFDVGGKIGHYLPDHGSAIAQTTTNAANYINSLRPDTSKKNPLDADLVPSKAQTAAFNRALDIAEKPTIVLKAVKDGTVTMQDLTHLKNIYPDLYARMQSKLHNQLIESVHNKVNIPYKTRIGLSMFLGQPLDSTMTPMAIMSAQPHPAQRQQQQDQQGPKSSNHSLKSLSKLPQASLTPMQARQAASIKQ